ncbi:5-bromo-4-chloroindolyl phosphate hydrolysis family protein [Carnobacterium divergens]|uniref:5-bromo-4-chloroindolyl phosphate hydrolysis family protein n=1 Tax=Carnobacterium divergens TaxID=2748 RepID=UPI0039AEB1B5
MYYFYFTLIILSVVLILSATQLVKLSRLRILQKKAVKEFQEKNQLSNSELILFKTEMKEAKSYIISIEKIIKVNLVLKENQTLHQTVEKAKEIFKHLMNEPRDLIRFADFLYRNLPSFQLVLEKYAVNGEQDSDVLTAICQTIERDFQKLTLEKQGEIEQVKEFLK